MTDTTERVELLALADRIDIHVKHGTSPIIEQDDAKKIAIALRHLASQDQKRVAWGRIVGGMAVTVSRERTPANDEPLYASPPPAAGWNEAIEATKKIAAEYGDDVYEDEGMNAARRQVVKFIVRDIEALRTTPAATKSDPPVDRTMLRHIVDVAYCHAMTVPCFPDSKTADKIIYHALTGHPAQGILAELPDHGGADAGVRVKPLEWKCNRAETVLGRFQIISWQDGTYTVVRPRICVDSKVFKDIEAAKAAAQSDYEQRILSALAHQPDAAETTASAEARLREAIVVADTNIVNAIHLADEFDFDDDHSGRLNQIIDELKAARKALSPDPHASDCARETEDDEWAARLTGDETTNWQVSDKTLRRLASDCDKQGCMGDVSPDDPKDLEELLSKPSVLEPSDRTADCDRQEHERELTKREQYCIAAALLASGTVVDETLRRIEEINENRRNAAINADNIVAGNPSDRTADVTGLQPFSWRQVNAYEACNGTIWQTAEEAQAESRRATDAYGMWRW